MAHAGLLEGATDEADVVGGTTAAAGLGNHNRYFIQVVFARKQCMHNLSHNHERRVAGIIINVLETYVYRGSSVVVQNNDVVSVGTECRL